MKKQRIQDERILLQRRKITSEAFSILWILLFVSVLVQQFIFNAPFSQYAGEFICFLGASVYIFFRNLMIGNNLFSTPENDKKILFINTITLGITLAAINGILSYLKYKEDFSKNLGMFIIILVITFVSSTTIGFIISFIVRRISKKRQAQIEKTLNDEDNIDEC